MAHQNGLQGQLPHEPRTRRRSPWRFRRPATAQHTTTFARAAHRRVAVNPSGNQLVEQPQRLERLPRTRRFDTFRCSVCEEDREISYLYPTPCDHLYCSDCARSMLEVSLADDAIFPPRCCSKQFSTKLVGLLGEDLTSRVRAKEKRVAELRHRVACHNDSCKTPLDKEKTVAGVAQCDRCSKKTCMICQKAAHVDEICPEDLLLQSLNHSLGQNKWQRCWQCYRVVEKALGCNHITCPCGAEFCYKCGERPDRCRCNATTNMGPAGAHNVDLALLEIGLRRREVQDQVFGFARNGVHHPNIPGRTDYADRPPHPTIHQLRHMAVHQARHLEEHGYVVTGSTPRNGVPLPQQHFISIAEQWRAWRDINRHGHRASSPIDLTFNNNIAASRAALYDRRNEAVSSQPRDELGVGGPATMFRDFAASRRDPVYGPTTRYTAQPLDERRSTLLDSASASGRRSNRIQAYPSWTNEHWPQNMHGWPEVPQDTPGQDNASGSARLGVGQGLGSSPVLTPAPSSGAMLGPSEGVWIGTPPRAAGSRKNADARPS